MFYVSLRNKKIEFSITHVEPEEKYVFSPDDNGVRELWNLLDEKNALSEVMFSSSVWLPANSINIHRLFGPSLAIHTIH